MAKAIRMFFYEVFGLDFAEGILSLYIYKVRLAFFALKAISDYM